MSQCNLQKSPSTVWYQRSCSANQLRWPELTVVKFDPFLYYADSQTNDTYEPVNFNNSVKKTYKTVNHVFAPSKVLKGAVCRILTLLKHKNTIICLQTFRNHVKLTYLFIWKTMLQSVILLWKCAVRPGMSVFVMVCETRPLPVYPIVFRHPGLPVAGKHSVFNLIHCHVRSFLLVSLIWHPAHASNLRRRGWWKKPSPIFWIWTAIPSSTARCQSYIQHL